MVNHWKTVVHSLLQPAMYSFCTAFLLLAVTGQQTYGLSVGSIAQGAQALVLAADPVENTTAVLSRNWYVEASEAFALVSIKLRLCFHCLSSMLSSSLTIYLLPHLMASKRIAAHTLVHTYLLHYRMSHTAKVADGLGIGWYPDDGLTVYGSEGAAQTLQQINAAVGIPSFAVGGYAHQDNNLYVPGDNSTYFNGSEIMPFLEQALATNATFVASVEVCLFASRQRISM